MFIDGCLETFDQDLQYLLSNMRHKQLVVRASSNCICQRNDSFLAHGYADVRRRVVQHALPHLVGHDRFNVPLLRRSQI